MLKYFIFKILVKPIFSTSLRKKFNDICLFKVLKLAKLLAHTSYDGRPVELGSRSNCADCGLESVCRNLFSKRWQKVQFMIKSMSCGQE